MKKRIMSLIFVILTVFSMALPVFAEETESVEEEVVLEPPEIINVGAAIVYNIENDRYIYELNADKMIYPASTAKLMTAMVAIEHFEGNLSRPITVNGGALIGLRGNSVGLKHGETFTLEQLLYALLCGGANDAANVLAFEISGGVEEFVQLMNAKAKELGANHTHYTNPTGMHDPAMVTTARDTAIIATEAYLTYPIADCTSVEKYHLPPTEKTGERIIYNKNYYFSTRTEYLYIWKIPRGLNAGYTDEGGYCLATTATRHGLTYVVIAMGATRDERLIYSYTEAAKLIKWAFEAYEYRKVVTTSDIICEMPVALSSRVDYVTLFPAETIEVFLPKGIDPEKDIKLVTTLSRDKFTAPVSEGAVGGKLTVVYNGLELATVDLITRNSVNRDNILYVLDLLASVTRTKVFKTVLTVVIIALIAYIAVLVFITVQRNRRKR